MGRPRFVEVLFGSYRRNILGLLLLRPEESFYVREIARLTRIPAGSLHRELKLLTHAGLLVRTTTGNQVRYQADRSCPVYEDLAGIFRKTTGLADVLRAALARLSDKIRLAFVFGSVAQGKERGTSDVDVMVVGDAGFDKVVEMLSGTHQRLRREINPIVMTESAFRNKYRKRERFVLRIVEEPKIFLTGDARELAELTQDRTTQGTSA